MQSPHLRVAPRLASAVLAWILAAGWVAVAQIALIALIAPLAPAQAQVCDKTGCAWNSCAVGAQGVPQARWGELQPLDAGALPPERDVTAFYEYTGQYSANPYYFSIDIQNGWAFTGMDYGVKVWDVTGGTPVQKSYLSFSQFLFWTAGEQKTPLQDVALPQGVDTVAVVGGISDVGLSIIDYADKTQPRLVYQNAFQQVPAVYAATIPPGNGVHYAFGATGGGLLIYNMDAATRLTTPCREDYAPGGPASPCPSVFVGKVANSPAYVAGVDQFVVTSYGSGAGFDIYDVSNPASPALKASGLRDRGVAGVAMWKDPGSGHYLLGARTVPTFATPVGTPNTLFVLDVNCITGTCGGSPPVLSTYVDLPDTAAQTASYFLTLSFSGNTPFLYLGSDETCGPTNVAQREWLLDVSNPSAPRDITPPSVGGLGYWGWYYMMNPTGFNFVQPRKGKFWGQNFYRAAQSIFDVHKHVGAVAPTAGFSWNPQQQIYPGTPVNFVDQSLGQPADGLNWHGWTWTFAPDGSPASSNTPSPAGVTFPAAGTKSVTLKVQNALGNSSLTQTLTVLPPQPQVTSISVSPASPLQCQPVTLTANGVSGQPPLTWAWAITNGANPATGGTSTAANSFVWDTKANANPPATYTAKVTITNPPATAGSASAQVNFTLGSLAALPSSGTFAPANDAFTNATVQFHVNVPGATEWNWDFGDGAGFTGWTNDPAKGPNPAHSYTAVATYQVRVQVRNCVNLGGATSSNLAVKVTQVSPLIASFAPVCTFGICAFQTGSPVTFTDSSTGADCWDYDWEGAGSFSDAGHAQPVAAHTYNNPGTFSPVLRVHRGGCAGAEQNTFTARSIVVATNSQPASISVSGPGSGSPNTAYTFSAAAFNCTPAATWNWSTPGGSVNGGATGSSISVTYASTGNYSVSASNSGCTGAIGSANISISSGGGGGGGGTLQAAFTFAPGAPKVGDTVSFDATSSTGSPTGYSWDFGDGTSGSGVTVQHVYNNQGTYTAKLDVSVPGTGPNCFFGTCVSEATKSVIVATSQPTANSDFTSSGGCTNIGGFWTCPATTGQPLTLAALETNPAANFAWDFGDGSSGTGNPVTHTWQAAGSIPVKLTVTGKGLTTTSTTKTFQVQGPQNPAAKSDFNSSGGGCANTGGFWTCPAATGQAIILTGIETAAGAGFAWNFGDGTTGSGNPVTHVWPSAGDFPVKLTVSGNNLTTTATTKTFQVRAPDFQSVVLPWVAATRGALVQSCDLYLHNPGSAKPLDVTLQFLKRGTPDVNPPKATATIQPGATLYAADVLQSVFSRDNIAGFVMVTVKSTDPLPIITSFNTVVRSDGGQFGQTVPGLTLPNSNPPSNGSTDQAAGAIQYLVGLNSNGDEVSYFGVTNPSPTTATYHVRLIDKQGKQIGESNGDLTVGAFGQRQFQLEDVHTLFGLTGADDYLVSIENKTGGTLLFPYGENVRQVSGDPSFVTAGATSAATQYVLGAFSTAGSWQSDVVLANTSTQPMHLTLTFTRIGFFATPTAPVTLTLNAGETQRLSNAIAGQWNLNNVVGVITVASDGAGGVYPIVQAESYNNAQPARRYGQSMRAFSNADAAAAGQTHYLVGLRQDATHLTTFWLFNNGKTDTGVYDVVYRALDGTVLGTVTDATVPAGKVRQFLPNQHLLPNSAAANGFTVQVVVKQGSVLTAAQVLTTSTGDPAYIQGTPR
jgi:PKD repeat protein